MKKYLGILIGLLPVIASAQLVMTNNYYVVLSGGTQSHPTSFVLTNPTPGAITNTGSGWIVSENEFNQVDWNIGTNTGKYIVPFGYGTSDYLPVTCDITTAGIGNGSIRFATYHGSSWDNSTYEPSDVSDMTDFGAFNYSNNAVDRFWILDASPSYTTKPTPDITLTYIRGGAGAETVSPNYIVEKSLIAQRFNSTGTVDEWSDWTGTTGTDAISGNTGTVTSGNVAPADFYRSWCLFNDSTILQGIPEVTTLASSVITYPNPTNGSYTVSGLTKGQVIDLYDYLGQRLTSTVVDNATMHFDISTKANGIYLLRIENKDGSLATEKKIVKTQ